ncbi:hypothetical protein GCM10022289_01020 [Pedobacter jeongneungensis]|uniref:HTH cro/C1-type domain-containing protein n=1 Tax=Pedobacter jeongneungensis TaxID=947309 RepID=A0ABP8B1Q3_9SPHI
MSYSDKYNSVPEQNSFGRFIKEQRSLKMMTQNDLASMLGLNRTLIAKIEINRVPFNYKRLDKLAEIFGADLTEVKLKFYSWHFTSLIKEGGCPLKALDLAKANFKKPDLK